jgi:hypothetical protein
MTDRFVNNREQSEEVLLDLHYLPGLEYFACLNSFEKICIESHEVFLKQTYRNRCYVLTANKVDILTVPVQTPSGKIPVRDVRIDYSQGWIRRHWGCLQSAYGKSPFFEYYSDDLKAIYHKKPTFLFDLNRELLTLCLKFIGLKKEVTYTLSYQSYVRNTLFDARSLISDKKGPNNFTFYKKTPYYQTFGNDFVPNLSIIDLLFNKGPESRQILTESTISLVRA